jgi:hypothetical protein
VYSDPIHHALAFSAKHYPERISRYDSQSCLIKASSIAIILARHGADEKTIAASILKALFDACPLERQRILARDLMSKFGPTIALLVDAAAEPRYDILGRERAWKAARLEEMARLTEAPPEAVDVCVASELHRVGSALVSARRLGVEYMETGGAPTPGDTVWWLGSMLEMLAGHPRWHRPTMFGELRRLADELKRRVDEETAKS